MSKTIFLDTNVLGLITNPNKSADVLAGIQWTITMLSAKHTFIVPAIADYEVRRELIRSGKTQGIASLNNWNAGAIDRYLPITESALRLASSLWAQSRNAGNATCDPKELDCDVLISAQILELGLPAGSFIVATTNVSHITQFLPCDNWQNITVNF
jgi:predicted nucleic acid-binding protein